MASFDSLDDLLFKEDFFDSESENDYDDESIPSGKQVNQVMFDLLNHDYDVFLYKLRRFFRAYEPGVSLPLLRIIFTSTPGSLEGVVLLSNGYLLAIDNGCLLEFGKPGDMPADQQAKAEDKANRRKQDELRSVGPRMTELLSHLGSQYEMGSCSETGGRSGESGGR
ncbi:hypothetical protein Tco_0923270 [Tanacetum coccineum]|uniref:Uncharacterized protein n=1 Tax=Tanacetum coccineum TaxID=301880 RepID=A0ABQ5D3U0_9ASTR